MDGGASFGSCIRQLRSAVDLTREELAEQVGCAVETIRKIERDQRRPSKQMAGRIADALGLSGTAREAFFRQARTRSMEQELSTAQPPAPAHNGDALPAPLTSLFGRDTDIAALIAILGRADVRLLTLLGPPGVGKTRLSLAVAQNLAESFRDGVVFVPLAPIAEAGLVVAAIARELSVKEVAEQPLKTTLQYALRTRQLLLVLDNFEQVVDAAPHVVSLLQAAPGLKVLITSRTPLAVGGEQQWPVPPLHVPPTASAAPLAMLAQYPAVALFIDRARTVRPDWAPSDLQLHAIAEICARLDGLPLAIELAAAQTKLFEPAAILVKLSDRLGTLVGKARDAATRQQTLRGAIDWSYELLGAEERVLFAELGVFVSGWTPAAMQAIHERRGTHPDDAVMLLAGLVDHSLVQRVSLSNGEPRFGMLETIREYAIERLISQEQFQIVRERHADYYLALAERVEPELALAQVKEWADRLETEHDNFRAALNWLLEQRAYEKAGRLAAALWQFWETRAYLSEGLGWLEAILAHRDHLPPLVLADVINAAGRLAHNRGEIGRSTTYFEENLSLRRQLGDSRRVGYALNDLGLLLVMDGQSARGVELLQEGLALFRAYDDPAGIADVLLNYGAVVLWCGDAPQAITLLEEGLALFNQVGNRRGCMASMANLGFAYFNQGAYQRSMELMRQSMVLAHQLEDRVAYAYGALGFGLVMIQSGQVLRGVELIGAGEAWAEAIGVRVVLLPSMDAVVEQARVKLGDGTFASVRAAGRLRPIEEVVAELQLGRV